MHEALPFVSIRNDSQFQSVRNVVTGAEARPNCKSARKQDSGQKPANSLNGFADQHIAGSRSAPIGTPPRMAFPLRYQTLWAPEVGPPFRC
jgi:hypothetical protein